MTFMFLCESCSVSLMLLVSSLILLGGGQSDLMSKSGKRNWALSPFLTIRDCSLPCSKGLFPRERCVVVKRVEEQAWRHPGEPVYRWGCLIEEWVISKPTWSQLWSHICQSTLLVTKVTFSSLYAWLLRIPPNLSQTQSTWNSHSVCIYERYLRNRGM